MFFHILLFWVAVQFFHSFIRERERERERTFARPDSRGLKSTAGEAAEDEEEDATKTFKLFLQ